MKRLITFEKFFENRKLGLEFVNKGKYLGIFMKNLSKMILQ